MIVGSSACAASISLIAAMYWSARGGRLFAGVDSAMAGMASETALYHGSLRTTIASHYGNVKVCKDNEWGLHERTAAGQMRAISAISSVAIGRFHAPHPLQAFRGVQGWKLGFDSRSSALT
jgi:hypothetical protein